MEDLEDVTARVTSAALGGGVPRGDDGGSNWFAFSLPSLAVMHAARLTPQQACTYSLINGLLILLRAAIGRERESVCVCEIWRGKWCVVELIWGK